MSSSRLSSLALLAVSTIAAAPASGQDYLPDLPKIMKQVSELRGIEFKKDVPAEQQSLEDFTAYVDEEMQMMFAEDRVVGMQLGLLRLGMITEEMDVAGELRDAVLSQAGGYYDPASGTFFYLMADLGPEFLDTIAAHELVHALQDQYHDLGEALEDMEDDMITLPRQDDEILAYRFLVEGEATYVQTLWQLKHMMGMDVTNNPQMALTAIKMQADMDLAQLIELMKMQMPAMGEEDNSIQKAMEGMADIPPYILYPLYAAYMSGAYLVAEVHADGGWDAVAAMFDRVPESSEQGLHPDKYGEALDRPTPIAMLEHPNLEAMGWELADASTHGEYYLRIMFDNYDVGKTVSKRAAAGWDGDMYQAYMNEDGDTCITLRTAWDSERDAEEFMEAWLESRQVKYDGFKWIGEGANRITYTCGSETDNGVVMRRGHDVFVVEGLDVVTCLDTLLDLLSDEIEHVD